MKKVSQVCRYVPSSPCPAYTGPEGDAIILITEDDSAIYVRLLDGPELYELTIIDRTDYERSYKLRFISAHTSEDLKMVMGASGWLHVEDDRVSLENGDIYSRKGSIKVDPELVVCPPMKFADA